MDNKSILCLLIDDDADDREIFSIALSDLDLDVQLITAKDGKEGLEKLGDESFRPDFIFLDLNMPRLNGRQCLSEIRKMHRFNAVPVIIYSTSAQQKDKDETLHSGASYFITKPSDIGVLTKALNSVFSAFMEPENLLTTEINNKNERSN